MPYVLISDIDGLTYYVQNYRGEEICLNGLKENAIVYDDISEAIGWKHEFETFLKTPLTVRAIPPYPQSNT